MIETRYEISDDDGAFRMGRDLLGMMLAEILMVDFIHRLEATAMGPLVIVRRVAEDTDRADPVLSILARYCIAPEPERIREVRHHQCRSAVQTSGSKGPTYELQHNHISPAESSWSDIP
jgi:hypothetical protein